MDEKLKELKRIAREHGGVLHPEHVVEAAANPENVLHQAFEWDDNEAAHQYRLEQARRLIRVTVMYEPHKGENIRAFVAIRSERYESAGYKYLPMLLKTEDGRRSVLDTALWEFQAFEEKYKTLKELAGVFAAMNKVRAGVY